MHHNQETNNNNRTIATNRENSREGGKIPEGWVKQKLIFITNLIPGLNFSTNYLNCHAYIRLYLKIMQMLGLFVLYFPFSFCGIVHKVKVFLKFNFSLILT